MIPKELWREIDQIGVLTIDPDKTIANMEKIFGILPDKRSRSLSGPDSGWYRGLPRDAEIEMLFYQFDNIHIEVIYPKSGNSIHKEYLEKRGTGLYHIRFNVSDYDEAVKFFYDKGYEPAMEGNSANTPGAKWCYYDFFEELGYYVEIINLKQLND